MYYFIAEQQVPLLKHYISKLVNSKTQIKRCGIRLGASFDRLCQSEMLLVLVKFQIKIRLVIKK